MTSRRKHVPSHTIALVEERIFLRVLSFQGILDYNFVVAKRKVGLNNKKRWISIFIIIINVLQTSLLSAQICFNIFVLKNYHTYGVATTGFALSCLGGIVLATFSYKHYEEISKLTRQVLLVSKYRKTVVTKRRFRCHLLCGLIGVLLIIFSLAFFWYRHFTNQPIEDYKKIRVTIINSDFSVFVWILHNFLYVLWPGSYSACFAILISWKLLLLRSCYENISSGKNTNIRRLKSVKRLENRLKATFSIVLLLLLTNYICFTCLLTMRLIVSGIRIIVVFFLSAYVISALCWESSRLEQKVIQLCR